MDGGVAGDVGGEGAAGDVDGEGAADGVMGDGAVDRLQMVCRLVAPLVLPVLRLSPGMLWVMVSSLVPMVRVTQAMQRVTVGPVCAIGDALGTGGGGPKRGLSLVQRAMVALMTPVVRLSQVMDRVTVLVVMSMAGGGCW